VHVDPPTAASVLVMLPGEHVAQAMVEVAVYMPALQGVHVDAPVPVSVFVTEPAPHAAQAVVEVAVYMPALQGVHVDAPAPLSVFVTLPDGHVKHDVAPVLLEYVPALHEVQVVEPESETLTLSKYMVQSLIGQEPALMCVSFKTYVPAGRVIIVEYICHKYESSWRK